MLRPGFVVVSDRGGHLHNALMLVEQMRGKPSAYVLTHGPDTAALRKRLGARVLEITRLFSWWGKQRFLNPVKVLWHIGHAFWLALKTRPEAVVSVGATNVVFYCYWARLFGARIYHVECMNQVTTRSITGRMLYPICRKLYVQWEDLLAAYGRKAVYAGWVL